MKILFWAVDCQADFMNPDGALYVQDAEKIKPNLKKLTDFAETNRIRVVNTADFHTDKSEEISDNPDFINTFPRHCMAGKPGSGFVEETEPIYKDRSYYLVNYVQKNIDFTRMNQGRNIIIYKDKFDVFEGNPHTGQIVENIDPDLVVVYGVATNVCVNCAVLGLKKRGYNVTVVIDAIKELPNLPIEPVIAEWKKQNVTIVSTDSLITYLNK